MATEFYALGVQGNLTGEYRENVFTFEGVGTSAGDTLTGGSNLITAFINHLETLWLACLPPTYSLDRYAAMRWDPKPSATAHTQNQQGIIVGTRGIEAATQHLCPSFFLVPPMGIKSGGKVFMPAVAKGDIVNNAPVAGYITATNGFFSTAIGGFSQSGITWTLAIWSRKLKIGSIVQSASLSTRLGYQGKRRKPVGAL